MYGSIDLVFGKQITERLKHVLKAEYELRRFKCRRFDIDADNPLNTVDTVKMREKPGTDVSGDACDSYILDGLSPFDKPKHVMK
jgi:hypothetical protein